MENFILKDAKKALLECPKCKMIHYRDESIAHLEICPKFKFYCGKCNKLIIRENEEKHIAYECEG